MRKVSTRYLWPGLVLVIGMAFLVLPAAPATAAGCAWDKNTNKCDGDCGRLYHADGSDAGLTPSCQEKRPNSKTCECFFHQVDTNCKKSGNTCGGSCEPLYRTNNKQKKVDGKCTNVGTAEQVNCECQYRW